LGRLFNWLRFWLFDNTENWSLDSETFGDRFSDWFRCRRLWLFGQCFFTCFTLCLATLSDCLFVGFIVAFGTGLIEFFDVGDAVGV
jgi:hypothetical protein